MITDLEVGARRFAEAAHAAVGQRRKYTGEPYIHHPEAVVALLCTVPHTPAMLAAAWLHDVVEDTPVMIDEIAREFSAEVAALVAQLTDVSRPEDGNRATRKAIDRAYTGAASPAAKTIKLADVIDNIKSIAEHDPKFARVYVPEKALLLDMLREGDATLWEMADALVQKWMFANIPARPGPNPIKPA